MNMKKIILGLFIILVLLTTYYLYTNSNVKVEDVIKASDNLKNATYTINSEEVTLKNGVSELPIPNSSSKVITKYFGNELKYTNRDNKEITAFIITQSTGGSGTFYYAVAALKTPSGYIGSDAVLLGDRIAPQNINTAKEDIISVNFAERKYGESFAVPASVGKSLWLLLDTNTMKFGQVEPWFTGEADPARMNVYMQTWKWAKTIYNNDTTVLPKIVDKFTLTLKKDGSFSATTDCNSVGGEYSINGNKIAFSKMISTLMYCENSQEQDFSTMLSQVESYLFTSKGEFVLSLKMDSGSMIFK